MKVISTIFFFLFVSTSFSQGSGRALVFDGTDNNIEIRSTFQNQNGTQSFSICAWVMSTNVSKTGQRVVCDDEQNSGTGGYALSLGDPGSGRLRFYCRALSTVSLDVPAGNYQLMNNVWYHVAAVYNQSSRTRFIYVNGELAATNTHTAGEWTTTEVDNGPLTIGGESNASSESANRFQGQIDEVSYWNKALSQTEIRDLMCKSLSPPVANLLGYWNFNGAALGANNVPDLTGNNFTGTMQNMVAGEIVTSAAPIGNSSVYTYTTTWGGVKLIHISPELDSLEVSTVSSATVNAIHIYHVNAVPNTIAGINGLGGNDHYFGVFKSIYNGGSGTYTARYFYRENDAYQVSTNVDPNYFETNLRVYTRNNNSSTPWVMNATAPNTTTKTITLTAQSTEFILAYLNNLSALPIELIAFNANLNGKKVDINWTTATEINNHYFTVERAGANGVFKELERVSGAGNSNSVLHYSTNDEQPISGMSYYRLKQTDFDGQFSYSEIVPVYFNSASEVLIYPNPVSNVLVIESSTSLLNTHYEISNALGEVILFGTFSNETGQRINTDNLISGMYYLKLISSQQQSSIRFIK